MLNRFRNALAALAIMLLAVPASLQAEEFNAKQQSAIEQIIKDYLVANPEVIADALAELEKRESANAEKKKSEAFAANRDAIEQSPLSYTGGNPDGDVTIVEFFDYNCGYCRKALSDLQDLVKSDPNLRFVLKEFPILRQESLDAAKVAVAALRQGKYMEFHVEMLTSPGMADMERALAVAEDLGLDMDKVKADIAKDDILDPIREAHQLANMFEISATPAYIIGDEILLGAQGFAQLQEKVKALREEKCPTC